MARRSGSTICKSGTRWSANTFECDAGGVGQLPPSMPSITDPAFELPAFVAEPLTVTIAEFCKRTGLARTSAFALCRDRDVESVLICGRRLIVWASVKALIERGTVTAR